MRSVSSCSAHTHCLSYTKGLCVIVTVCKPAERQRSPVLSDGRVEITRVEFVRAYKCRILQTGVTARLGLCQSASIVTPDVTYSPSLRILSKIDAQIHLSRLSHVIIIQLQCAGRILQLLAILLLYMILLELQACTSDNQWHTECHRCP